MIDIETVSSVASYQNLNERLKRQWERKSTFLKNQDDLTPEELFYERAGIYAEFGKVICVAAGFYTKSSGDSLGLRIKAYADKDEKKVLNGFKDLIDNKLDSGKLILCAHNGKEFDFPYLCRRYLVNGIAIPRALQIADKKPWEIRHVDTMEFWKFGDRRHYTSLDLLASLFDIDSSKSDMDGSMVNKTYYEEDALDRIIEYCKQDVVVTANLYLKFNLLPPVPDEHIQYV